MLHPVAEGDEDTEGVIDPLPDAVHVPVVVLVLVPLPVPLAVGLRVAEAVLLLQYLRAAQWNVSAVARRLGLSRMTLYRRMHRFGIVSPNQQSGAAPVT